MKKNLIVGSLVFLSLVSFGVVAKADGFRDGRERIADRARASQEHPASSERGAFKNAFLARHEGDHGCTAPTSTPTFTITASAVGGTIAPSGSVTVSAGGSETFTATANPGFQDNGIIVDGVNLGPTIGTTESYTFTDVNANHTIEADFTIQQIN